MPSIDEISRDNWEVLSTLPQAFLDSFAESLKLLDRKTLTTFHKTLSALRVEDLEKLQQGSGADVITIYKESVRVADETDSVVCVRNYLMENPILFTQTVDDVIYTIKSDAAGMEKDREITSTQVRYILPCEITLEYAGRTTTLPFKHIATMGINKPQSVKSTVKRIETKIHEQIMHLPKKGFKFSELIYGSDQSKKWIDNHLDAAHFLWDHPRISPILREPSEMYRGYSCPKFRIEALDFVKMYFASDKYFSHEIEEEESIAFVYEENFKVYTKKGAYFVKDGVSNQSNLYKKLQLATDLTLS